MPWSCGISAARRPTSRPRPPCRITCAPRPAETSQRRNELNSFPATATRRYAPSAAHMMLFDLAGVVDDVVGGCPGWADRGPSAQRCWGRPAASGSGLLTVEGEGVEGGAGGAQTE